MFHSLLIDVLYRDVKMTLLLLFPYLEVPTTGKRGCSVWVGPSSPTSGFVEEDVKVKIEIAILLKRVLLTAYYNVAEVRILYNEKTNDYTLELKTVGATFYFEDDEAVIHHLEGVLINK